MPAITLPWLGGVFDLAVVQVCVVALASLVSTFVLMATSGQRTERELRESQRKLRVLANIDMLTQVPNRRRFEELARRAIRADEPGSAALLLVDIDHFKQVNDRLGHAAGDRALKLVSRCTLDLLRAQEELHHATRDLIDALADQTLSRYRFLHLAADLTPLFGVPVDAPAPAVAPIRWLPGGR